MDFHAVVEADIDGVWSVVGAIRLALTRSLVRISSGQDASDTAFRGVGQFRTLTVTVTTDGPLPAPDDTRLRFPGRDQPRYASSSRSQISLTVG